MKAKTPRLIGEVTDVDAQDYSQHQEQDIIVRFFQKADKDSYTPYFVDVGAYDGITGSNSRFLAELGWAGLVIEPNPTVFGRLEELYEQNPAVTAVQSAVSDYASDAVEMMVAEGPEGVRDDEKWQYSQVSTLNEWFAKEYIEEHNYQYGSVTVRVRTLTEILIAHDCPPDLGLLCVDCEGEDYRLLEAADFSRFQPRLLGVECDDRNRSMYVDLLGARGYREYDRTSGNTFFAYEGRS